MPDPKRVALVQTRIANGVWEGELSGAVRDPVVEALHGGVALDGVTVAALPGKAGRFAVRVPIPVAALNQGVQTFVLQVDGQFLTSFTLVAGEPPDADLRAELSLMRAELDLLKRAFQRHCRET